MAVRIAVDAMGGDHAPKEIVRGAVESLADSQDHDVVLVGDESRIKSELEAIGEDYPSDRLHIVHASQVVEMCESPTDALRKKKDSSIIRMCQQAAAGEVDAVISAGNTGAMVASAQLIMRPLKCISRPGIAAAVPSFYGPVVLCDVGANVQVKPHQLYQYAVMASIYSRTVLGTKTPRVGLLSVGEEDQKGTDQVREAREMLESDKELHFVGNIEGKDVFANTCEVAVCDGFVGNILLKLIEGLAEGLFPTIKREFATNDEDIRTQFESALNRVWARHDFAEYGGAPLLGINGVCIISHGRSDHRAIRNAVRAARLFVSHNFNDAVVSRLGD